MSRDTPPPSSPNNPTTVQLMDLSRPCVEFPLWDVAAATACLTSRSTAPPPRDRGMVTTRGGAEEGAYPPPRLVVQNRASSAAMEPNTPGTGAGQGSRLARLTQREELIQKATFGPDELYTYKEHPLRPGCHFFLFLTKTGPPQQQALGGGGGGGELDLGPPTGRNLISAMPVRLRIPPTLLLGGPRDSAGLVVFFSDSRGQLQCCENASAKLFRQLLQLPRLPDGGIRDAVVAGLGEPLGQSAPPSVVTGFSPSGASPPRDTEGARMGSARPSTAT
eukprot:RCo004254